MRVVRRGHEDRVDLAGHLVEHLAKVNELLRLRKLLLDYPVRGAEAAAVVDIRQGHQVLGGCGRDVLHPAAVGADHRHAQFRVGRTLRQEGGNPEDLRPAATPAMMAVSLSNFRRLIRVLIANLSFVAGR